MQVNEYYEEVGLIDMVNLIRRNTSIVMVAIILGLILSTILTTLGYLTSKPTENFQIKMELFLENEPLDNVKIDLLKDMLSNTSVLHEIMNDLDISPNEYEVFAFNSDEEQSVLLQITGENANDVIQISRSMFEIVKKQIENILPNIELKSLGFTGPIDIIQGRSNNINYSLTSKIKANIKELNSNQLFVACSILSSDEMLDNINSKIGNTDFKRSVEVKISDNKSIFLTFITNNINDINQITNNINDLIAPYLEKANIVIDEIEEVEQVTLRQNTNYFRNLVINSILSIILSVLIGLLYIFLTWYMSTSIVSDKIFEYMFESVILGKIYKPVKKSMLKKLFEVK